MRTYITLIILSAVFATCAVSGAVSVADGRPYGHAPNSLTWRLPPDGVAYVARGTCGHVARFYSDIDAWARAHRTRQHPTRYGHRFTIGGRVVARWYRSRARMCARRSVRVYVWLG